MNDTPTATRWRWLRPMAGALLAEVGQVAAAFVWVAFYSHLLDPGQPMAVYQQHAQAAGPWVSVVAGVPLFYVASRWLGRSLSGGLALFSTFLVVDLSLLLASERPAQGLPLGLFALSYSTKLAACALGGLHGAPRAGGVAR